MEDAPALKESKDVGEVEDTSIMMLTPQKFSGSRTAPMKGPLSKVSDLEYQFDKRYQ